MAELLSGTAVLVFATVAVGLLRALRGPTDADRMMAVQLLGTGGVAVLLLGGAGADVQGVVDAALVLALLAAFAAVAFMTSRRHDGEEDR